MKNTNKALVKIESSKQRSNSVSLGSKLLVLGTKNNPYVIIGKELYSIIPSKEIESEGFDKITSFRNVKR